MPAFGRIPYWDERNLRFLVRDAIGALPLRGRGWQAGPLLDQGDEGTCIGHGFAGELGATPVRVVPADHALALAIYDRAVQLDPFPGTSRNDGTTILAGVQATMERGYYAEYRWALTADDVALAIGYEGPVVIGVDWHDGMMEPDSSGTIHRTGLILGGHCVYVRSVSVARRRFRIRNSWGDWGPLHGDAWLSWDDLDALLVGDGEACVPMWRSL